ncbi:MAG: riboflavin synthase [Solibacillus sp.]
MFTGIIEEVGIVAGVKKGQNAMHLTLKASKVMSDMQLGDSIAVNGVCLTVTDFSASQFQADVMPETFQATNLNALKVGASVNLERAMPANGRLGGHMVSGHVDGIGVIKQKRAVSNAVYVEITLPEALADDCIMKGSITLDGTSLTIFSVQKQSITVSLIPHTYAETILGTKKVGEHVNVETDLVGKYVKKHMQASQSTLTKDFLTQHGF